MFCLGSQQHRVAATAGRGASVGGGAFFRLAARTNGAPFCRHSRQEKNVGRARTCPGRRIAPVARLAKPGSQAACSAILANAADAHYGPTMVQEKVQKLARLWSHFSRSR